ncbi:pyridoxamine 5'-phosphate oxidase family protein [archaeon]|jgi:uncharacterized protein YhbP (UPF0306 family)|nr:pyridoxamine 5'-phosphate oxidase family protein [archaeon]MBT6761921.1 pyridoxamine 5'-phosphate oxidase family protein [archaeon]
MDTKSLVSRAKKVMDNILYLTLATCDENNNPWNSPVYSAFNEKHTFYWVSWKENQHSKNIAKNGNVFAVIYDSSVPEGTGFGVYLKGKARQLKVKDMAEILNALKLMYSRKRKKIRSPKDFLGLLPRRIYKFEPENVWVNVDSEVKGSVVDSRVDITKDLLN